MIASLILAAAVAYAHPEQLVDTAWVARHARDADVRVLDLRRSGFEEGHVPGALWLDPESIRDAANAPSFMLPPTASEQAMGRHGISNRTRVILYDDRGGLLASRLWWMFNAYGHSNVALMDGGWVQWTAEKRPATTATAPVQVTTFRATLQPEWLATVADQLRAIYGKHGVMPSDEVIAYCWVGHRSAVDLFALRLIGYDRLRNYLGSWEEWSRRADLPTAPFSK